MKHMEKPVGSSAMQPVPASVSTAAPRRRPRLAALGAKAGIVAALALPLASCGIPLGTGSRVKLSEPPPSMQSTPSQPIMRALMCIHDSRVLNRFRFGIAVHSDGTGKSQFGYEGATGSFLPQGTAAIWASEAVIRAGGLSMNYYELNTERALRQFGGANLDTALATQQQTRVPNFIISTAFTALDFIGGPSVNLRASGIGPYFDVRGASLEVSAEMYRPGDRMTMAISSLNRQVFYQESGIGVGRIFGKGKGELVTGSIGFTDQQRLQEATRDVIALAVADVLASMPVVPDDCRRLVENLKAARNEPAPAERPQAARGRDRDQPRDSQPDQPQAPQNQGLQPSRAPLQSDPSRDERTQP